MALFARKKSYMGIDIGTSSLKIVELKGGSKKPTLVNYASCDSPVGGKGGGEHKESFLRLPAGKLRQVLDEILTKVGFESKTAAISVPIYSTFTTVIHLPSDLEEEDFKDAIKYKAKKHVPVPLSEVMLEWHSIQRSGQEKSQNENPVFIAAVPKDIIEKYRKISADLEGLEIELLEIEIFSMARVVARQVGGKEAFVIVDIGGKNTNVTLVRGESVVATFNVNISGEDFTRALMSAQDISFAEAEVMKYNKGVKDPNIKQTLQPLFRDIIAQLQEKDWVRRKEKPRPLILSGGSVNMPGLRELFEQKLNTKVSIINPWVNFNYPSQLEEILTKSAPSYAVACGLALRGL